MDKFCIKIIKTKKILKEINLFLGQKFAMMEIKVTLSYIFRNFHVTSMDKREDVRLCPDAILRPKDGITIKLSRRT